MNVFYMHIFCIVSLSILSDYWWSCHKKCLFLFHLFEIFVVSQVWGSIRVSACTLLMCGGTGYAQSEPLNAGNFGGLAAWTAGNRLDWIFPDWGFVYGSKGCTSRCYWPVPARFAQAFKVDYPSRKMFCVNLQQNKIYLHSGWWCT